MGDMHHPSWPLKGITSREALRNILSGQVLVNVVSGHHAICLSQSLCNDATGQPTGITSGTNTMKQLILTREWENRKEALVQFATHPSLLPKRVASFDLMLGNSWHSVASDRS